MDRALQSGDFFGLLSKERQCIELNKEYRTRQSANVDFLFNPLGASQFVDWGASF